MSHLRVIITVTAAAVAAAGCHAPSQPAAGPPPASTSPPSAIARPAPPDSPAKPHPVISRQPQSLARPIDGLVRTHSCAALLDGIRTEATREVTAYGLADDIYGDMRAGFAASEAVGGAAPTATTASSAGSTGAGSGTATGGTTDFSTTNNQEAGVDEPDEAKTDGHVLVMIRHRDRGPQLQIIDVTGEQPKLAGDLRLRELTDAQLLLDGPLAIAVGSARLGPRGWRDGSRTRIVVVDISDPEQPRVVRSTSVTGGLVDARFTGGRVLVVTQSGPRLRFHYPQRPGRLPRRRALAFNRHLVETSTLSAWVPRVTSSTGRSWPTGCDTSYRTRQASGVGAVSVISLDPASDGPGTRATVFGNAGTVYASTSALYLATNAWIDWLPIARGHTLDVHTEIHGFDISDPAHPTYLGSGRVRGTVLDQYSLSEYDGDLRVASTVGDAMPPPGEGSRPARLSVSEVTVLKPQSHELVEVGRVTGLGRGERIYGVRFVGDLGYVVTFRQTDPLFVVDLKDPTHPFVAGELKVTGYSAYLHPLGDDMLFGLGMSVDHHLRETGVQASTFDVSNPNAPRLLDRTYYRQGASPAEYDHHQFLWWSARRIAVVPVEQWTSRSDHNFDAVLHVAPDGTIREIGRVQLPLRDSEWAPGFERALVIGDLLYTVSEQGVLASHLDELTRNTWLSFR